MKAGCEGFGGCGSLLALFWFWAVEERLFLQLVFSESPYSGAVLCPK
jgi:hypothetical protein